MPHVGAVEDTIMQKERSNTPKPKSESEKTSKDEELDLAKGDAAQYRAGRAKEARTSSE